MIDIPNTSGLPKSLRAAPRVSDGLTTLVVSGGRPGLGTTTLAIQLAAALAQEALRVVLIDADLSSAAIGPRCNVPTSLGIGDVLTGRKNIHEVLQRGPSGMQVLAGATVQQVGEGVTGRSVQRLLKQMHSLARHTDWLVVDAGHQPSEMAAQLWSAADHVLMVTSPDSAAIMDTYALIKTIATRHAQAPALSLIVNRALGASSASDVHRRIDQSCRRFLGVAVDLAAWLPMDPTTKVAVIAAATLAPAVLDLVQRLHERRATSIRPAA